jgi:hypothetical protein
VEIYDPATDSGQSTQHLNTRGDSCGCGCKWQDLCDRWIITILRYDRLGRGVRSCLRNLDHKALSNAASAPAFGCCHRE